MTVREQYLQVLFNEITVLNGDNTEEALNIMITQSILDEKIKALRIDGNSLVSKKLNSEIDMENTEVEGVYLYDGRSLENFVFERYNTIADAVRHGVKLINAKIIHNGNIITYDTIDNDTAYYIDDRLGKLMLVNIAA